MGDDNVVKFNTVLDVKHQRYILDFLSGIDLESSMAYLPVTIHDPYIDQDEYNEYLYKYISDEIDCLIDEIAHSDPKLWKRHYELLSEQLKDKTNIIRFCIVLTSDVEDPETHELVLIWDTRAERYVITNFNYNHESLVSVATYEYLNPDLGLDDQRSPVAITTVLTV